MDKAGTTAKKVLRIVGINEATYYYRKHKGFKRVRVYNGGRPIPGFSLTQDGHPVPMSRIGNGYPNGLMVKNPLIQHFVLLFFDQFQ